MTEEKDKDTQNTQEFIWSFLGFCSLFTFFIYVIGFTATATGNSTYYLFIAWGIWGAVLLSKYLDPEYKGGCWLGFVSGILMAFSMIVPLCLSMLSDFARNFR